MMDHENARDEVNLFVDVRHIRIVAKKCRVQIDALNAVVGFGGLSLESTLSYKDQWQLAKMMYIPSLGGFFPERDHWHAERVFDAGGDASLFRRLDVGADFIHIYDVLRS